MSLSGKIFIFGLLGGTLFGALLVGLVKLLAYLEYAEISSGIDEVITSYIISFFEIIKQLFMNALKMVMVPLVLVSLICGTCSLSDPKKLGPLAGKSLALYLLTTCIAITMALILSNIFDPGMVEISAEEVTKAAENYKAPQGAPPLSAVFSGLVPSNIVQAMSAGNMLQIIIFAIIFGIAISKTGEAGRKVADFFESLNDVVLKLITIIMNLAPYAVFCIMAYVVYTTGVDQLQKLFKYFFCVAFFLILHFTITYPTILIFFAKLNPITLWKKIRPAILFALSTSSSAATLPVTMEVARKRLGVGRTTSSFTLPMGATINMDGTAIMQGVATVFIAQLAEIDLTMTQYLMVILMATLASIGTAAVPSVGLVTLTMVLTQVNLPTEAIAMLLGVDRLLDMMRTAVNVTGDITVATIVSKSEDDFSIETYNDPNAGLEYEKVS